MLLISSLSFQHFLISLIHLKYIKSLSQQRAAASISQETDRGRSSPQWFSFNEQTVMQPLLSARGSDLKTRLLSDWLRVLLNSQSGKGCPPRLSHDDEDEEETGKETQKY